VVTKRGGGKQTLQEVVKYMRCNPMIMRNPPKEEDPEGTLKADGISELLKQVLTHWHTSFLNMAY